MPRYLIYNTLSKFLIIIERLEKEINASSQTKFKLLIFNIPAIFQTFLFILQIKLH